MSQQRAALAGDPIIAAAAPLPEMAPVYHLRMARSLTDIIRLRSQWLALEALCPGARFFQSYEFCRNAAEHDVLHGEQDFVVLGVYQNDSLVALLPLRLQKKRFRTVLSGLAEPFQQYTEMLLAPGHDARAVFRPIRLALNGFGADYLHLGQVRRDGPLFAAIDGDLQPTGEDKGAPNVPLHNWPDLEAYFKSLNAKSRKNLRNLHNKLARTGEIAHQVAFEGPLLDAVIERTFAGRTEWLARMGLTSRAFRNSGFEAFVDRFKDAQTSGVKAVAMCLTLDGKPIAEQWGFVYAKRYYAFISTWDVAFHDFSPGRLHLEEVLRACSKMGLEVVDFMVPSIAYKLTYAIEVTPVNDYVLPLSPTGRLYSGLWVNRVRPLAKTLAYALPAWMRKTVLSRLLPQASD